MRSQAIAQGFVAVLLSLSLAACGGGGVSIGGGTSSSSSGGSSSSSSSSSSGGTTSSSSSGSTTATPTKLTLVSSNGQLSSNAALSTNGVTLTAIVKDANNNLLTGVPVQFSSTAGAIQVTQGTTDDTGSAVAILSTGGDPTNQNISVTASVVSLSSVNSSIAVVESGTTLSISGTPVVGLGATQAFTVTLRDGGNSPISNTAVSFVSANGNTFTPATGALTNSSGQVTFTVTGSKAGNDTLTASALGATSSSVINVSVNELSFSAPASGAVVKFGSTQPITVVLQDNNGNPQSGKIISLTADRGTLTSGATSGSAVSATTGANGSATVIFTSDGSQGSGGVTVTATAPDGTSVPLVFSLIAVTPASISIQANPTTIGTSSSSTVQALVLDAKNNPVPNVKVDFIISADSSGGGSLSTGTAFTNTQGQAIVLYQSGPGSSAANGVAINATVDSNTAISTAPSNPALLTVASNPFDISMGASTLLSNYPAGSADPTEYQQSFAVVVKDSSGHPAPANTVVTFQLTSTLFQTGYWAPNAATAQWVPVYNIPTDGSDSKAAVNTFGCINEDTNLNGILDADEKTYMINTDSTILYPGNVGTVTSSITLDSTGSGQIVLTYPKDYSEWVQYDLRATTQVVGTQYSRDRIQVFPVLAADVDDLTKAPPGTNMGQTIYNIDPTTGTKSGVTYGSPFGLWQACDKVAGNAVGPGVPGFPGP